MDTELMDKLQSYNLFWNGFGLKAYNETSVPDNSEMPYITYEAVEDDFDHTLALTANVWYRSTSWADSVAKVKQIHEAIGRGGRLVAYDNGAFWIRRSTPWAQRVSDENDDSVRRTVLNIEVEFID